MKNDYKFTISDRAKSNLIEAMQSSNNVIPFLESEGYIHFEKGTMVSSKALYLTYCKWCEENAEKPMSPKTVLSYLKQNLQQIYQLMEAKKLEGSRGFLQRYVRRILKRYRKKRKYEIMRICVYASKIKDFSRA